MQDYPRDRFPALLARLEPRPWHTAARFLLRSGGARVMVDDATRPRAAAVMMPAPSQAGAYLISLGDAEPLRDFLAEEPGINRLWVSDAETEQFVAGAFEPDGDLKMWLVGQAAPRLAEEAGLSKPDAKLIVFEADASRPEGAQARERLAPVLSFFTVSGDDEAMHLCKSLLEYEGTGHTANVHTKDMDRAQRFADAMPASRVLVNVPSAHGCSGIATNLPFTLTLGCGTWGGNITTNNVGHRDVRNVKRMALPREG